jgi:hypothetical protein
MLWHCLSFNYFYKIDVRNAGFPAPPFLLTVRFYGLSHQFRVLCWEASKYILADNGYAGFDIRQRPSVDSSERTNLPTRSYGVIEGKTWENPFRRCQIKAGSVGLELSRSCC